MLQGKLFMTIMRSFCEMISYEIVDLTYEQTCLRSLMLNKENYV